MILVHRDKQEWEPELGRRAGPGEVVDAGTEARRDRLLATGRWEDLMAVTVKMIKDKPAQTRAAVAKTGTPKKSRAPRRKRSRRTK